MPTGLETIKFFETLDKDPEKIIRPKVNLCGYMFDCLGKNGIFFPILISLRDTRFNTEKLSKRLELSANKSL